MPYDRYSFSQNTKKDKDGKTVYKSILYPEIPVSEDDIYIIAKETDRLDLLAYKYYGDVTMWWIIAKANQIRNTFFIPAETQIRIPKDISSLQNDLNNLNRE